MPLILLSDTFSLTSSSSSLQIVLGNLPQTALESVYPSELPPMMKSFFCAMEMKLPEAWSPLANTLPALGEVHRNVQHKETWNHWRELAEHTLFLIRPYFTPFCATYFRYALIKISILPSNTLSAFPVSSFVR